MVFCGLYCGGWCWGVAGIAAWMDYVGWCWLFVFGVVFDWLGGWAAICGLRW